ncbi:MAG: hypothetical protein ACI84C_001514, partial [Flavobacteriales bacterium]
MAKKPCAIGLLAKHFAVGTVDGQDSFDIFELL